MLPMFWLHLHFPSLPNKDEVIPHCGFLIAFPWGLVMLNILSCCCLVAQSCLSVLWPHGLSPQAPLFMEFPRQEYWSELPSLPWGTSWLRDWTSVSCIGRRILYHWATREAQRLTYLFQLVFKNKTFILNPWFHGHYCLGQTSWGWYSIDQLRFGASWSSQICHTP